MGKDCWIGLVQVDDEQVYTGVDVVAFTTPEEPAVNQDILELYGDASYTILESEKWWEISSFDERDDWEQNAPRLVLRSEGWEAVLALMQDDSYALVIPDGDVFF